MALIDHISSTEKLLDVIRNSKTGHSSAPGHFEETARISIARRLVPAKRTTIGIDLGYKDLKLVRILRVSEREYILKDYLKIPFPEDAAKERPQFAGFLRSALQEFGGIGRKEQVWCSMSTARVEVGHITIPKVGKNQIANAVSFTVRKQNPFDEGAFFMDFEVQGEVMESGIPKIRVLYYVAPRKELDEIKSWFHEAGARLAGVTIGPFANQNLFRTGWLPAGDGPVGSLYIGRNWSRIDIFSKKNLVLTRGIKAGMNSMVEALTESFNERVREAAAGESAKKGVEIDQDQARKILLSISPEMPQLMKGEPGFGLSPAEKFAMMEPAAERLVRQVERTFEHFATILRFERVQKVFISGGIDGYRGLTDYIGDELGMERDGVDPMDPRIPGMEDAAPPESLGERTSYTLAVGLALSDNARTPNLVFPYEFKERAAQIKRFNNFIFVVFIVMMAVSGGFHIRQKQIEGGRQAEVTHLQHEIARYGTVLDQARILSVAGQMSAQKETIEEAARRYEPVAVLGEISSRTPETIRLLSTKAALGRAALQNKPKETAAKGGAKNPPGTGISKTVAVEGLVFGDPKQFDSILAGYLVKLQASPLLRNPKIEKTEVQRYKEKEVLRFALILEVV